MILPDLISKHAKERPAAVAYCFRDEKITYGELEQRVLKTAQGLQKLGITKGTTFGVVLRNSPEFVILAMALSRLGAVIVPINFLEKADRIALILNDAQAIGVLSAKEFYPVVKEAAQKTKSLQHIFLRDGDIQGAKNFAELSNGEPLVQWPDINATDLMMLLYTSGTTGLPKGVMLTHKNFLANVEQCMAAIKIRQKDIFLCLLPMFHSFSWTTCVLIPLWLGTTVVIVETLLPFDPVIKKIWHHRVTLFVGVPQIFSALATKISGAKAFIIRLINPVRICISGAAPLPAVVHKNFEKNLGVPLLEGYGLTETSPVASLNPESKRKVGTVGKPLPGVQIEIRGDEGTPQPQGEVGEIWIKGDNVMSGYYHKPAESAEVLTQDGWLKTGDMGRFDEDGYLSIVDRKKDLIIVKGLNVYPQEVEAVIAQYEPVKEVAVVGKPDPATGEEMIRAFVTIKENMALNKQDIFSLCREQLAAYKRPREIIVLDEMPKNALQKILKKDLRNR